MLASTIELEVAELLLTHADKRLDDGRSSVVRNDYLPSRSIQTGVGSVDSTSLPKLE